MTDQTLVKHVIVEGTWHGRSGVCLDKYHLDPPAPLADLLAVYRNAGTFVFRADVDTVGTALIVVS